MKIELQNIKVSDLVDGYADNQEGVGVGLLKPVLNSIEISWRELNGRQQSTWQG